MTLPLVAATAQPTRLSDLADQAVRCFAEFTERSLEIREACRLGDDERIVAVLEERWRTAHDATALIAELLAAREVALVPDGESEGMLSRVLEAAAAAQAVDRELEATLSAIHQQLGRDIDDLDSIARRSDRYRHVEESHSRALDLTR